MPRSVTEAKALRQRAILKLADLVEIRLDRLEGSKEFEFIKTERKTQTIATIRQGIQGGLFKGQEEEKFETLMRAAKSGFDYVDIEDSTPHLDDRIQALRSLGSKVIVSHHNLASTPPVADLRKILKRISKHRPDIIKIVTTATSTQDNLTILNFLHNAVRDHKIVSFAMGEKGKISRITSPIFGAYFTIASLEDGAETAQGQLTIDDLRRVYGVIGLS